MCPDGAGGDAHTWDANGNLTSKGDLHFEYDYRNRLTRVTRNGHEVAAYGYDAFNRRVEKSVDGAVQQTTWSGWQALEKSENGQTTERRVYGNGLDELVQLEKIDAGTNLTYAPVYDAKGNLALLTDGQGRTVERAETSTYGQTVWHADSTPPAIVQVRLKDGAIELRTSEEVRFAALQTAISGGKATLRETATNDEVSFLAIQDSNPAPGISPTRLIFRPSEAIAAGAELQLRLEPEAIQDLFGIPLTALFEQTITWQPTADTVIADTAPPEVSHVLLRGPRLEIRFTESVNAENAEAAILLDGEPRTWTIAEDREVWTTPTDLTDGDHTLSIAATPLDLAGKPLAEAFERTFRIEPSHLGLIVYRRPSPSQLPTSATGSALTFQGLELDAETGLLYVRNRYFDSELGRFITADPTGYPDGPNGYAFGGGDSVNGRDPMGLANSTSGVGQPKLDYARMERDVKAAGRFLADPYVQGTLQILGGCSEAIVGALATAGTAGAAAVPGFAAMLHGSDTCAAGLKTLYYGKVHDNLTTQGIRAGLITAGVSRDRADLGARVADAIAGASATAYSARSLTPRAQSITPAPRSKPGGAQGLRGVASGGVIEVDPRSLRSSQTTAGGRGRADTLRQSMTEKGWSGDPIDVVQTSDGLVAVDHTRAAVAMELGIERIPVRVHFSGDPLPPEMVSRPWNHAGQTATTWGEAVALRGAGQTPPLGPTGSASPPRLPRPGGR